MINKLTGIAVCSALLLCGCSLTGKSYVPQENAMDTSSWQTHCFGRFQIDLPANAKVISDSNIWSKPFKRTDIQVAELPALIDRRIQELKQQPHETEGSMFIRKADLEHGGAILMAWSLHSSTIGYQWESFNVAGPDGPVYSYPGFVSPKKELGAEAFRRALDRSLMPRAQGRVPQGPGFCIDGGFLAGNDFRAESVMVSVSLPEHPRLHIEFTTSTRGENDDDGLLDRLGGWENGILQRAMGLKTLRKGRRNVGSIPAEEYLVHARKDGQSIYTFAWEAPGQEDSITEPELTLGFEVPFDEREDAPPRPPAFKSKEEALQLWDAVLDSIRPHPGI